CVQLLELTALPPARPRPPRDRRRRDAAAGSSPEPAAAADPDDGADADLPPAGASALVLERVRWRCRRGPSGRAVVRAAPSPPRAARLAGFVDVRLAVGLALLLVPRPLLPASRRGRPVSPRSSSTSAPRPARVRSARGKTPLT